VKFHVGSKKMRPESGRMENWYVIAIPKIDSPAALVLDPGYGFALDLLVDTTLEGTSLPQVCPDHGSWRLVFYGMPTKLNEGHGFSGVPMSLRLTLGDENHGVRWFSTVP
jgi:hypothetical protein